VQSQMKRPWGLRAIAGFYVFGVVVVAVTLLTNRAATGEQLAAVHGLPVSAGTPAILLTLALGVLVALGLDSMRTWGYWLTLAYMGFLMVVPALTLGSQHVSVFANFVWPMLVILYLLRKRSWFGVGASRASTAPVQSDGQSRC
jgi:phosphatidylserine synthase